MRNVKSAIIAAAAISAALSVSAGAQVVHRAPLGHGTVPSLAWSLKCLASGSPVEFPNDVALVNNGPGTVPKGTKIHWKLNNYAGDYVFAAALAKGGLVRISNVLGGGVAAGTPCTATKI
jgi:hypothetical protein